MQHNYRHFTFSILALFFLFNFNLVAQDNNEWLKRIGGIEENFIKTAAITQDGNIIIAGNFYGESSQLVIDSFVLANNNLPYASCAFIAKLDSNGNAIWAQTLETDYSSEILNTIFDSKGNIYAIGRFAGQLNFNNQVFHSVPPIISGFFAKYTPDGKPIWLNVFPVSEFCYNNLTIDPSDNIYTACGSKIISSTGSISNYLKLKKFDNNGNLILDKILAESSVFIGPSIIKLNTQLEPVLLTAFNQDVKINSQQFSFPSSFGCILLKCSATGSLEWVKPMELSAGFTDLALDSSNNHYISSRYNEELEKYSLLKKFDSKGNLLWALDMHRKLFPFMGGIAGSRIQITQNQDIVLAGYFSGEVQIGDTSFSTQASTYHTDMYVARLNNEGRLLKAFQSLGGLDIYTNDLLLTNNNNFYISGFTKSLTLKFNHLTSHTTFQKSGNDFDGFILKSKFNLPLNQDPEEDPKDPTDPAEDPKDPVDPKETPKDSLETEHPKELSIPNIITPNGDNKNEMFVIENLEPNSDALLLIYNRLGKKVYHSQSYKNDWAAKGLPAGTYYYTLHDTRNDKKYKGWVTVMR